jgi:hypothetical protein
MKNIFKKKFSFFEVIGLAVVAMLGISIIAYAATSVPHIFSSGMPARAGEVNANFAALRDAISKLEDRFGIADSVLPGECPSDMAKVGTLCVDRYEASIWSNPDGTGQQYGIVPPGSAEPTFPDTFPQNGNWTEKLYAVSKPGLKPARYVTWFQAQQSCALSGKRLLTNAEWQMAAAGTPDPGLGGDGTTTCNTNTGAPLNTGSSENCKSSWGVYDMVGNVWEWVADTTQGNNPVWNPSGSQSGGTRPPNTLVSDPGAEYGGDAMFGANPATNQIPGDNIFPAVFIRGGHWGDAVKAGVFAQDACSSPSHFDGSIGFRCAVPVR